MEIFSFSGGDSVRLIKGSLSSKDPDVSIYRAKFRLLVKKVLWKLQGDFFLNIKNNLLDTEQISQGFHDQVNPTSLFSFRLFCEAIQKVKKLRILDLSGCNINAHFAIELSDAIKLNTSLEYLSLANCNLSAFSLSCVFQALSHNTSLTGLNLMNNQCFNLDAVEDFCEYVLKGKTNLSQIILTHCNIDNYLLSIIFRNIRRLKTLKCLKVNLMSLNSEGLFGLRSLLMSFSGKYQLDYLDLSYNYINDAGIILLYNTLAFNFQNINIKQLNLSRSGFTSKNQNLAIIALESLILKFKNLQILNVSLNQITEFTSPRFLEKSLVKIDLSRNFFSEFPANFLLNVQFVDLSMNLIRVRGAYHLSQILSRIRTQWQTLNLNDNLIMTEGFIAIIHALSKFNQTLVNLSVANNMLDGHAILYYASNHTFLSLQSIDLSRNLFRYQLVYALLNMLQDCSLCLINFSKIIYQKDELQIIDDEQLLFEIKCFNVRFIDFSYNPKMIHSILRSLSHSFVRLESVNLSHCNLMQNDSVGYLIKFLQRASNLHILNLSGNKLGLMSSSYLKILTYQLGQCLSLQQLNLQYNQIRQNLKVFLVPLQSLINLLELDLSNNMIDESQHIYILRFFELSHVQVIDLSKNFLSMQCLEAILNAFQKISTVQVINLSQNKLNGQHLLSLEKIIERDQLRGLNLSSNNQLEKLRSFFYTKNIPVIKSITLNNLQFNQKFFNIFLKSIQENKRKIQSIDIENTLLQTKQLNLFLMSISSTRQLQALSLQYVSFKDNQITQYIVEHLMPTLKRLSRLSLVKCVISEGMWNILLRLTESSQSLQLLDLSGNFLDDENLPFMIGIIRKTKSIRHLILQNCDINDTQLQQISIALNYNYTISTFDISQNKLGYEGFLSILNVKNTSRDQKLTSIILSGCFLPDQQIFSLITQHKNSVEKNQLLQSINLSDNEFLNEYLFKVVQTISDRSIFPKLQSLNLSQSHLNDNNCEALATLLKYSSLTELNLSNNQISDKGLQLLFRSLEDIRACLRLLNLEKNHISQNVFVNTKNAAKLNSLKILNIASNFNYTQQQCSLALINIYRNNPELFIFNHWSVITEELAGLIIISYTNLYKNFTLKSSTVPDYLKVLKIENSEISDQFCVNFANSYLYFPYLETLSFSNSPRITKYGKIYLYLTLFQDCYQDFSLKHFYFNEERNFSTIFDDGIWDYMLINIKFWLQSSDKNPSESSKSRYEEIVPSTQENKGRMGLMGKFLINIINKSLQVDDQHFTFSSNFMKYLIQNQAQIKIFIIMQSILRFALVVVSCIVFSGTLLPTTWAMMYPMYLSQCTQQASEGYFMCGLDSKASRISLLYQAAIAILSISILLSSIDMFVAIQVRKKANPDYKILSPQTNAYLKRNFPHKEEILLYFFTIFDQMSFFFAFNQIYNFYQIILSVRSALEINSGQSQSYKQFYVDMIWHNTNCLYILIIVVCFKFLYQQINQLVALRQILITKPDTQRVEYLNAFWRKCIHEHNYVLNSFLSHFCPQKGQRIFKAYFTQQQIEKLIQAFLIELPQLILSFIYVLYLMKFLTLQFGIPTFPIRNSFFFIGLMKYFATFIVNIYHALTTKHPKIKEQEFNQALFFRRFWKNRQLSVIEFKTNEPFPIQMQASPQSDTTQQKHKLIHSKKAVQFGQNSDPNLLSNNDQSQQRILKNNENSDLENKNHFKLNENQFDIEFRTISKTQDSRKPKQD